MTQARANEKKLRSIQELIDTAKSSRPTVNAWRKRSDFPPGLDKGGIPLSVWLEYVKVRQEDAQKKQTGKDSDLKRAKLEKQIELLHFDILKAKREDDIHRIEYEAKRGLWYSVDQLKEFAGLVVSGFEDAVSAVELSTRDAVAVAKVREAFDRIRARLSEELAVK